MRLSFLRYFFLVHFSNLSANFSQHFTDFYITGISPKYAYIQISKQGLDHPAITPLLSAS